MADKIIHGSTDIVNSSSVLQKAALADSGVTAATYSGGTTSIPSVTVDAKGFVTSASTTTVKMTGVDFLASGNTLTDQTIFVNANAPTGSDGADGDVWYHTIS
jgi:hypothetical protein